MSELDDISNEIIDDDMENLDDEIDDEAEVHNAITSRVEIDDDLEAHNGVTSRNEKISDYADLNEDQRFSQPNSNSMRNNPVVKQEKPTYVTQKTDPSPNNDEYERKPEGYSKENNPNQNNINEYLETLSEDDRNRYNQLLTKNEKLKEELKHITDATQGVIDNERNRKREKYTNEQSEEVKELQAILKERQTTLTNIKNGIIYKKKELDNAYQYPLIREKEDELKNLRRVYNNLKKERDEIEKIKVRQQKNLHGLHNDEYEEHKNNIIVELRSLKDEIKELKDEKTSIDKDMNKYHQKIVNAKIYVRNLKSKLEEYKKKHGTHEYNNVKEEDLEDMEEKIQIQETKKEKMHKAHMSKLKNQERQKKQQLHENQQLEIKLQERDKIIRQNKLKMNELKRIQKYKTMNEQKKRHNESMQAQSEIEVANELLEVKNKARENAGHLKPNMNRPNMRLKVSNVETKENKNTRNKSAISNNSKNVPKENKEDAELYNFD